jgi:hypothetical protein
MPPGIPSIVFDVTVGRLACEAAISWPRTQVTILVLAGNELPDDLIDYGLQLGVACQAVNLNRRGQVFPDISAAADD